MEFNLIVIMEVGVKVGAPLAVLVPIDKDFVEVVFTTYYLPAGVPFEQFDKRVVVFSLGNPNSLPIVGITVLDR